MKQLITSEPVCIVCTEPVAEAIREHETNAEDWTFHETAARFNQLYDQLNIVFFNNRLPKAVISMGPDLIVRYGYYQIGRDEIGAMNRVHLNSRHFGRTESDVAVTLLHEMLHIYQHLYGTPARRARYHNKEFVCIALSIGIEAEIGIGVTKFVSDVLRQELNDMGFSAEKPLMSGMNETPVKKPVRKVMWQCACKQEIWINRDSLAKVVCEICRKKFERAAYQQNKTRTVE